MKKAGVFFLGLLISHIALAVPNTAATISIVNHLTAPLERTGASFGCGAYSPNLSSPASQEVIQCQYQGVVYYEVTLPATNIVPDETAHSTVIAYPTQSPSYGKLGFQYTVAGKPKLGCSLIMDFSGDTVTELHIQPLYPNPWITCTNKGSNKQVKLVIAMTH